MNSARTRFYYMDAAAKQLHARLIMETLPPVGWIFLGESNTKPAIIAPLYLRNMKQDPDEFQLIIEKEPITPTEPRIDNAPADPDPE